MQGAEVLLIERTDMLLGTGLVGGIMRNNGRFTAAEEMVAMSGGELFQLTDTNSLQASDSHVIQYQQEPFLEPLDFFAFVCLNPPLNPLSDISFIQWFLEPGVSNGFSWSQYI
jgi:hypothetical protein